MTNNNDNNKLSPQNSTEIMELYGQVGRLTGRMDSVETRQMLWEQKIEKRLTDIEELIKKLSTALSQGQGAWKVLTVIGYLILAVFTILPQIINVFW